MEDAGVKIDEYRMAEITARLSDRVEELEAGAYELAGEEFMLGSTQQVAAILFEKLGLTAGRKGKTGYSTDKRVLRSIRDDHPIVEVIEEWREYSKLLNTFPEPPACDDRPARPQAAHDVQPDRPQRRAALDHEPDLQAIPIRTELGRRDPQRVHRPSPATARLGRLLAGRAAHSRARLRRAEAAGRVRARRGHPRGDGGRGVGARSRRL